jgi:hypothetical protein
VSYFDPVNNVISLDPVSSAPTPSAGQGFVYYDSGSSTVKLSQNGGGASDLATMASAAGWAYASSTVTLTTASDHVGIGAAPGGLVKLSVTGDATFKDVSIVGGNPGGSGTGGSLSSTGGQGGGLGTGGSIVLTGGSGGSTSGVGGAVSVTGGSGAAGNSTGGSATVQGGSGQGSASGATATLQGGVGGATGNGANTVVNGGVAGSAAGTGGEIVLQTAKVATGTTLVERLRIASDGAQDSTGIATGSAPAVSASGHGRLYYDSSLNSYMMSLSGAAYAAIGSATATFQASYNGGPSVSETNALGPVIFTNSDSNNNDVLQISKTPSAPQAGSGITVTMGANATSPAAVFSGATTASATIHVGNGITAAAPVAGSIRGTSSSAVTVAGGALTIAAGDGNTTGVGGAATLQGGVGGATGAGGAVAVQGGTGGTTTGTGGVLTLAGGVAGLAANTGGSIVLRTARSTAGTTLVDRLTIGADGGQTSTGITTANAPAVSAASSGSAYFDSTQQRYLISENAAAYRLASPFQQNATATGTITTTSTTDVLATSMTLTPEAGTYVVWFSGSAGNSTGTASVTPSIYSGGSQVTATERQIIGGGAQFAGARIPFACIGVTTVNGSQAIEGRWRVSAGTGSMLHKTLLIVRIA